MGCKLCGDHAQHAADAWGEVERWRVIARSKEQQLAEAREQRDRYKDAVDYAINILGPYCASDPDSRGGWTMMEVAIDTLKAIVDEIDGKDEATLGKGE